MVLGALLGLVLGVYTLYGNALLVEHARSLGTVDVYLFALLVVLIFNTFDWLKPVLFRQKTIIRSQILIYQQMDEDHQIEVHSVEIQ